jgi:hypothetical protein
MLHVHVRGELERVRDALWQIAKERRTLIAHGFRPSDTPNIQRTELSIGAPSLDVPTKEIAELYAELVTRASRRASARTRTAR